MYMGEKWVFQQVDVFNNTGRGDKFIIRAKLEPGTTQNRSEALNNFDLALKKRVSPSGTLAGFTCPSYQGCGQY